ncbi:endonuclease domain-containing protein [Specibacter sp. NPDC057265]|uniref:endonuclease domain-containing protein n=1 Tax=Specibacter sp. NPDC057265 TaxID=3346075 RepID=UPI003625DEEF
MKTPKPLPVALSRAPFTLETARSLGITGGRVRAADLSVPSRGIRVPKDVPVELLDHCRVLTQITPGGIISHITAAKIYNFHLPRRFDAQSAIDIARHAGQDLPRRRNVKGHELHLGPQDVQNYAFPITSMLRTLLDIAPLLTVDELVIIMDQLVCEHHRSFGRHVYPRVALDSLKDHIVQHPGNRGVRKLRAAVDLARIGSDSPRETMLRLIIERSTLPRFEHNVEILDSLGRGKVSPDLACKQYRTCAEYDGLHHFTASQQVKDHDRDFITKSLGWHQVLINADDMRAGEQLVIAKLARALKLGGWPDPENLANRSLHGLLPARKDFS